jgi:AraC-like DNA-binding protein
LKKGFKELSGTTVFGFCNDVKMGQARKMLLSNKKTVGEVADLLGYKNLTHFSAAFKRKYEVVPSAFKKTYL